MAVIRRGAPDTVSCAPVRCPRCHLRHLGRCGPEIAIIEPTLTHRENQIIYLLCDGRSNSEMAEDLGLSEHTIKRHIAHIFDKAGKYSRLEVAMHYYSAVWRTRVQQLETELAEVKKKSEIELAQEKQIVARLEATLRREAAITDLLVRNRRTAKDVTKGDPQWHGNISKALER